MKRFKKKVVFFAIILLCFTYYFTPEVTNYLLSPRPVLFYIPASLLPEYGKLNITLKQYPTVSRGTPVRVKNCPHIALAQCPLASIDLALSIREKISIHKREATPRLPMPPELRLIRVDGRIDSREINEMDKVCDYDKWKGNLYPAYNGLVPPAMIARSPMMYIVPRDLLPHFTVVIGVSTMDNAYSGNEDAHVGPVGPTGWVRRHLIRRTWSTYDEVWPSALLERYMREKQHGVTTQALYKDKQALVRFITSRNHHVFADNASDQLLPYDYSPALVTEASQHRDVLFLEMNEGRSEGRRYSNGGGEWGMEALLGMARKSLWWYALAFQLYSFDYLMKSDDDTYIRIPHYVHALQTVTPMISQRGSSQRCGATTTYRGVLYGKVSESRRTWCWWNDCVYLAGMAITMSRDVGALLLEDSQLYELTGAPYEKNRKHEYLDRHIANEDVMVGSTLSRFAKSKPPLWWWEKCPATNTTHATYDNHLHSPTGSIKDGLGILPLHDCRYIELDRVMWDNRSMVVHHVKPDMYTLIHKSFTADSTRTPHLSVTALEGRYLRIGCGLHRSYDDM